MAPKVALDLMSEIERQQHYLDQLPSDFQYPVFNGRQAVESQRKSGYKTTASAARELIDNSLEAGAKNVHVVFERKGGKRGKHERHDSVSSLAVVDDGPGMLPGMARFALTWGGGTHYEDPKRIGKFGFGLPNASINQCRRLEVYTRTSADAPWSRTHLDINEVPMHGGVTIDEAVEVDALPPFVEQYLEAKEIELPTGTVVVWVKPDRLTYRMASKLREHLIEDFGVTYRGLLDDIELVVDGKEVQKVDPLFLTPDALLYEPPPPAGNGAELAGSYVLAVKYTIDDVTGGQHLELLDEDQLEEAREQASKGEAFLGTIEVRIARFPYGFALGEKQYQGTDAFRRYEVRKDRRGMSFVRAGREIETVDVFPKANSDEASGLGKWPSIQSYAYHWAIEVRFGPEFDEVFGIGNDKQTVRPIEDFWRVLVAAEIDKALRKENEHQRDIRKKDEEDKSAKEAAKGATTAAMEAAARTKATMGGEKKLPPKRREEAKNAFEEEVERRAKVECGGRAPTTEELEKIRTAIEGEAKRKKFAIDFFEAEGGVFYKPSFGNGMQRVVFLNKAHPFFTSFYSQLVALPDRRPRNALDLLLYALADAELEAEAGSDLQLMYQDQRERGWSHFLKQGLRILDRMLDENPEEREENKHLDA